MGKYNWSKEILIDAIGKATNHCDALRLLGIPTQGNNLNTLKRKIIEYNLDVSHFTGRKELYGTENKVYKSVIQYLGTNKRISSSRLKTKLIAEGYKENKCEICGLSEWNGRKIVLQLHHLDGNHNNNELDNLQILCPNCHSQTDNYCNSTRNKNVKFCPDCGKPINKKSNFCKNCSNKNRYKDNNKIPSKEELIKTFVNTGSFTQVGKHYGVSDNAVRKWFIKYNLPIKSVILRKQIREQHPGVDWECLKGNTEALINHNKSKFKKVAEIDCQNKIIKIFNSREELIDDGLIPDNVYKVCRGELSKHHNRKFIYWELV